MKPDHTTVMVPLCKALLRPIASLLLKCGVTWREFADIAKSVFVEVAGEEYGISGRLTNISRVSLLTGISRKEVKRQRELMAAESGSKPAGEKTTCATRLLSGWHQDGNFSDGRGRAIALTDEAFADLYTRYGSDVPASVMLKELLRVGAIVRNEHGELLAASRYYMPMQSDPEWLRNAGSYFEDLGRSINFNLSVPKGTPTRFVGRATEPRIDPAAVDEFYAFIDTRGQEFLEQVDDWLAQHPARQHDAAGVRLGAGLFLIDNPSST